jgi:hypothetical protein
VVLAHVEKPFSELASNEGAGTLSEENMANSSRSPVVIAAVRGTARRGGARNSKARRDAIRPGVERDTSARV